MDKSSFIKRLVELRMNKGVSARDMSLSLGQSVNYINGIENGHNLPSLISFFYICEYLEITPQEFFDIDNRTPSRTTELVNAARGLDDEAMKHLIEVVKRMK